MNKYQNGKIYKIINTTNDLIYYGSTIRDLNKRFNHHKNCYKNKDDNITVYQIFDKYGIENCKIELVENYPCNSKRELELREGYYIKNNNCVNIKILGKTRKEYYNENKEAINIKKREWEKNNKEKRQQQAREWKEKNKEAYKEYQKQYRLNKKTI